MVENRVCIIGAGPAGLATARALKLEGVEFDILEKHSDVGGMWDPNNPGSPIYQSAHFISSKTMSGHHGFPMPEDYPDYPSNRQVLSYIQSFAKAYGLRSQVQFDTKVKGTKFEDGAWTVCTNHGERNGYRWLVAANGVTWFPKKPTLPDQDQFQGTIMHSIDYHNGDQLRGKRVLVVGAGNSGVDIACDAANYGDSACISLRRGYHFLPKHLFGIPIDVFGERSSWVPLRIQQFTTAMMLRVLLGDLRRLGLPKPDHRILESHPIINSQLLHYLQHGDLSAKPDIKRLERNAVVFKNGSREEIDLIILATGYDRRIPFLPEGAVTYQDGHPQAFLRVYQPKRPELFINGFIETNGGAYKFFDHMAQMIALNIRAQIDDGKGWQKLQGILRGPEPNLAGGVLYVASERHHGYVNASAFAKAVKHLRKQMGWPEFCPGTFDGIRT